MSNYQGPATLVAGASEIQVEATLSGSLDGETWQWGGSVQTGDAEEAAGPALDSADLRIRFPDGREGPVVATHTAIGSGRLKVSGSGEIPF
ncbi:DUF4873 domain-containing protein [Streptomyces sp. NPDC101062]|uniref:DUF4873 domain-containing protein n=1 Tax=unclassified Streptomyces TaxID=2593676 RepID=UPI002E795377|nr:DUF4873 domain-containing protein [Streptomyces sp. JV176]MEE1801822.1 DUF4873 domain-containing protein [Streptomyces sp. JV176]